MFRHIGRLLRKVYRLGFILKYILYLPETVLSVTVRPSEGRSQPVGPRYTGDVPAARTSLVGLILLAGLLQ